MNMGFGVFHTKYFQVFAFVALFYLLLSNSFGSTLNSLDCELALVGPRARTARTSENISNWKEIPGISQRIKAYDDQKDYVLNCWGGACYFSGLIDTRGYVLANEFDFWTKPPWARPLDRDETLMNGDILSFINVNQRHAQLHGFLYLNEVEQHGIAGAANRSTIDVVASKNGMQPDKVAVVSFGQIAKIYYRTGESVLRGFRPILKFKDFVAKHRYQLDSETLAALDVLKEIDRLSLISDYKIEFETRVAMRRMAWPWLEKTELRIRSETKDSPQWLIWKVLWYRLHTVASHYDPIRE